MAGQLVSPSYQDPVKAMGFYSFKVSIPDNDFYTFQSFGPGYLFVSSGASQFHHGFFYLVSNNLLDLITGNSTVASSGALNGTTGVDGDTTVSSDGLDVYIENRSGISQSYTVTILCPNQEAE